MYLKVKMHKEPEQAWMVTEAHNIEWTFRPRAHWTDMCCPAGTIETWVYGGMKEGDGGNLGGVDLAKYPPHGEPIRETGGRGIGPAEGLMFAGIFFKDGEGKNRAVYTNLDAFILNDDGKTIQRIC